MIMKVKSYNKKITMQDKLEIIDDTVNETEEFRYSITSYGADYTVDSNEIK